MTKERTATLVLTNTMAIQIKILDDEHVAYRYSDEKKWNKAKIHYQYSMSSDEPEIVFYTKENVCYNIKDFVRDDIGG